MNIRRDVISFPEISCVGHHEEAAESAFPAVTFSLTGLFVFAINYRVLSLIDLRESTSSPEKVKPKSELVNIPLTASRG